jgi:aspartate racemase
MEQDFAPGRMQERHGIEALVPQAQERVLLHQVIYDELCHGIVRDASRDAYRRIIDYMRAQGVGGVILGGTEIALLLSQEDVPLQVRHHHAARAGDRYAGTEIDASIIRPQ